MPKFHTIKKGDVLWDCRKTKMGNTTMSQMSCWQVVVKEIDHEQGFAICSWNGNPPTKYYATRLERLRRSEIKPKPRQVWGVK